MISSAMINRKNLPRYNYNFYILYYNMYPKLDDAWSQGTYSENCISNDKSNSSMKYIDYFVTIFLIPKMYWLFLYNQLCVVNEIIWAKSSLTGVQTANDCTF